MKRLTVTVAVLGALVSLTAGGIGAALGATQSGGHTATVVAAKSALGRILVDGKGRTLYLFEKDGRGRSACTGACATYWPPLLVRGQAHAGRGVKQSLLRVVRRSDGGRQATYAGHPLYRYVGDVRPGQTVGQGSQTFGARWYVVSPAGKKIDDDHEG